MTPERIRELLAPLTAGLEADGFRLDVSLSDDFVDLRLVAGPQACDDCLIPQAMMEDILLTHLNREGDGLGDRRLRLTYPAGF